MVLDVFSRYGTSVSSDGGDDVVNFADIFQGEDLSVKNLIFEGEGGNNKVEDEDRVIKNEEQTELRTTIPNNLPFTIVIPRRQRSKKIDNNTRKYNLKRSIKGIR